MSEPPDQEPPQTQYRVMTGAVKFKLDKWLSALKKEDALDFDALKAEARESSSQFYFQINAPTLEALGWFGKGTAEERINIGKEMAAKLIPALENIRDGTPEKIPEDFLKSLPDGILDTLHRLKAASWGTGGNSFENLDVGFKSKATASIMDLRDIFLTVIPDMPYSKNRFPGLDFIKPNSRG